MIVVVAITDEVPFNTAGSSSFQLFIKTEIRHLLNWIIEGAITLSTACTAKNSNSNVVKGQHKCKRKFKISFPFGDSLVDRSLLPCNHHIDLDLVCKQHHRPKY